MRKTSLKQKVLALIALCKLRITFTVCITSAIGYFLTPASFRWGALLAIGGLFLTACASAAINQIQEANTDAKMLRTKGRPIPAGILSKQTAIVTATLLLISGSVLLQVFGNFVALILSWITLLWYNVLYTPLKRKTAFAVIPGSIIGALPPMIGWAIGNGSISDPQIIVLSLFMFFWQIPHFWLLMLHYSEDYQRAGFPVITKTYSINQVKNITFVWILATAISGLILPLYGLVQSAVIIGMFFISSLLLILLFIRWLFKKYQKPSFIKYFSLINIYLLIILGSLSIHILIN